MGHILQVNQLSIGFEEKQGVRQVVDEISFHVAEGEILGIVGESGSGKSITSLTIMDLLKANARVIKGEILFEGRNLLAMSEKEKRALKGKEISMVFQEPMTSLNPLMKVGPQVEEVLLIHTSLESKERKKEVLRMFGEVGLKDGEAIYQKYPHQLSGGMRQRIMIAMAMICRPKLLIADEPTTALDVTVQKQILELLKKMNRDFHTSIIFISHDLSVVRSLCRRAVVMNEGKIVELGEVNDLFTNPKEAYTKRLLAAVPTIGKVIGQQVKNNKAVMCEAINYSVFYEERKNGFFKKPTNRKIVDSVSFQIMEGEIYGVVGESGSGKSTLAKAIVGLNTNTKGELLLESSKPQMVFQDPYSSLNPAKKIESILAEPLRIKGGYSKEQIRERVLAMLEQVGLPKEYASRRIDRLSGGQRQRVAIGLALMNNPSFLVLDEPVSALDVTIQDQILHLLKSLQEKYHLTYLFISHDLSVVYNLCDRIAVMKDGKIVEEGTREEIYSKPNHEYTKQLLEAVVS